MITRCHFNDLPFSNYSFDEAAIEACLKAGFVVLVQADEKHCLAGMTAAHMAVLPAYDTLVDASSVSYNHHILYPLKDGHCAMVSRDDATAIGRDLFVSEMNKLR